MKTAKSRSADDERILEKISLKILKNGN